MFAVVAALTAICRVLFMLLIRNIKTTWAQDTDKLQKIFQFCETGWISNSSQQQKLYFSRLHP